ncbi:PAS domain-containing protein [Halobaculum litoreum]|uniref:histidine kinase n=1 Tax=Halobaculum litoreum TaxID=3031998 RepID=A0ABD5XS56_9EURY
MSRTGDEGSGVTDPPSSWGEADDNTVREAFDRIDDPMLSVDTGLVVTDANAAAVRAIGRPRAQVVGRPLSESVTGDDKARVQAELAAAMRHGGGVLAFETAAGGSMVCSVHASDTGVTLVGGGTGGDSTTGGLLVNDVDRLVEGYFAIDTDWRVVRWNAEMERRTGVAAGEIVGTDIRELFTESMARDIGGAFDRAFETGEPVSAAAYVEGFDYWVELSVYPSSDGLSVYSVDVTDRRERERTLRATTTRLELALEGTDTGVWEWNVNGGPLRWYGSTEPLVCCDPDGTKGGLETFVERVHPEDRASVRRSIEDVIERGGPTHMRYRVVTPGGASAGWRVGVRSGSTTTSRGGSRAASST